MNRRHFMQGLIALSTTTIFLPTTPKTWSIPPLGSAIITMKRTNLFDKWMGGNHDLMTPETDAQFQRRWDRAIVVINGEQVNP